MSHAATPSRAGWQARLELKFEAAGDRTRLTHRRHHGPLLVQRVFHPEAPLPPPAAAAAAIAPAAVVETAAPCHAYILHPPGGVVSGDDLLLQASAAARAHVLLTTPAAGKFYRRRAAPEAAPARLRQELQIDAGAILEWLPQENIYYPDTEVELCTRVHSSGASHFIGWEIGCLGLPAQAASLAGGCVRQGIELWRDDRPLLIERLSIDGESLAARWGLAGHAALGTWLALPAQATHLAAARACLTQLDCAALTVACTLVDGVLICRALGARADWIRQRFIELWCALRPALIGRAACLPRIWST